MHREKRSLAAQVEKLEAALASESKQHQQAVDEAQQRHLVELQELQSQLQEERKGRVSDMT